MAEGNGLVTTGIVAVTVFDAASITETVFDTEFATKTLRASGVRDTPKGELRRG